MYDQEVEVKTSDFASLCSLVRKTWTRREGVILRMHQLGSEDPEVLLCVGGAKNPDLTARECIVWYGDSRIYEGPLESDSLKTLLTDSKVCYCEITNARLMEHDASGTFLCLLAGNSECTQDCPLKGDPNIPTPPDE